MCNTPKTMIIQPEELPLHLSRIDTCVGEWLISVHSAAEAQARDTIHLRAILEQRIDDERFSTRELGVTGLASDLYNPELLADVTSRIRHWVETTEGDGFLDLTHTADRG